MKNINDYIHNADFKSNFENSNIFKELKKDFDQLSWDNNFVYTGTLRQVYGDPTTKMSLVPFYYLNYLLDKNPKHIYDLGCGWNIFKKYIPNIIGIGAEDPATPDFFGDQSDFVDTDYIIHHQDFFESVFSINALHYISMDDMPQRVLDFASKIGRAHV